MDEAELTADQRAAVEIIYAPYRSSATWPEYQYVDKTLYRERKVDARELLPTFQAGLIYPDPAFANFYLQPAARRGQRCGLGLWS